MDFTCVNCPFIPFPTAAWGGCRRMGEGGTDAHAAGELWSGGRLALGFWTEKGQSSDDWHLEKIQLNTDIYWYDI
jgi:hypothetical protein